MQRGKTTSPHVKRRLVWRITETAPQGEFVDPSLPSIAPAGRDEDTEPSQPGWTTSSFELLKGVEVSEEDPSTVPAELFDELFKKA